MSFFKVFCSCSKEEKTKPGNEKRNTNNSILSLESYIGHVKTTRYGSIRYIIPYTWMYGICKIKHKGNEKLADIPHKIKNEQFINKSNQLKDNLKVEDICLVIREYMVQIVKSIEVDYVIKIPLHNESQIDFSEAIIYPIEFFYTDNPKNDTNATQIKELYLYPSEITMINNTAVLSNAKQPHTHSKNQSAIQGNDVSLKFNQDEAKGHVFDQDLNVDGVKVLNIESSAKGNNSNRRGISNGFSTTTMGTNVISSKNKKFNTISTNDQTYKSSNCSQNMTKKRDNNNQINHNSKNSNIFLIELDQCHSIQLEPIGLNNPSVYCFMNTCLQCLTSIPELNYYFYHQEYKSEKKSKKRAMACNALSEFLLNYQKAQRRMIPPRSIYDTCHSFLDSGTQHDCQEFLRRFLGAIQDELNWNKKYIFPDNITQSAAWKMYREVNPSFVDSLFTGLMTSNVKCCNCGHVSYTYDPVLDLSLSLEYKSRENLKDCLKTYFQEEKLDSDYKCSNCNKKTSIKKKLDINLPPPILTIQLKRFGDNRRKINTLISFEPTLSLEKYTSKEVLSDKTSYDLIAVAVHLGSSISSGHYIAYVKRDDLWYLCDDSDISRCSLRDALSCDAYLLFYRQQ